MSDSAFPRSMLVETTLRCPADCVFCPNKKIRGRPQDMPWELFRDIVDQCRGKGLAEFHPFLNGEPLASPFLEEALDYVSRTLPDTDIHIYTNGYLLDEEVGTILLKSNVRQVHFSLDGLSKRVYEEHRRGLAYERVMANIRRFLARLGEQPRSVRTRAVFTMTAANEEEAPAFRRYWEGLVDAVDVLPCDGRGGAGRSPAFMGSQKMACFDVASHAYILSDGSVVPCCKDWAGYSVLGNVGQQSLDSIWNSNEYRSFRDDVARGVLADFEVCRRCVTDRL